MLANPTQIAQFEQHLIQLKQGQFVTVTLNEMAYAVASIESLNEEMYKQFVSAYANCHAVISSARSSAANSSCLPLNESVSYADVKAFAGLSPSANALNVESSNLNYDRLLSLLALAELMPAALIAKVETDSSALEITESIIDQYATYLADNITSVASSPLQLRLAPEASISVFKAPGSIKEHYAITIGQPDTAQEVLVRIHSSSFINDILQSERADDRSQLDASIDYMNHNGGGVIVYMMQEGRGIGLTNVIRAYQLQQEQGLDTVDANRYLGFADDERRFDVALSIVNQLGLSKIKLLTNNPKKLNAGQQYDVEIVGHIPVEVTPTKANKAYLETKASRLGHMQGNDET